MGKHVRMQLAALLNKHQVEGADWLWTVSYRNVASAMLNMR